MESFILHIIIVVVIGEVIAYIVATRNDKLKEYKTRITQIIVTTALMGVLVALVVVENNNKETEKSIASEEQTSNNDKDAQEKADTTNKEQIVDTGIKNDNSISQKKDETQEKIDELKKPEIEKMDESSWIALRISEFKQELLDNELIENNISVAVNGNTLKVPFNGEELTKIGVNDASETEVPPMAEAYGRIRKLNGKPLELTYLNMSTDTVSSDNCMINGIILNSKDTSLKFNEGQEITVGTPIEDVVKALYENKYPLEYFGNSDKIEIKDIEAIASTTGNIDRCCSIRVSEADDSFTVRLNTYNVIAITTPESECIPQDLRNKASDEVRHFEYTIEGTLSNGVDTIAINCNAINVEVLAYRHDLMLKEPEIKEQK